MVVSIKGKKYWLWRPVDTNGYVLDALLQSRRNKAAAMRLMRKLLKDQAVTVYENPQQLDAAITRGGQAVSIGLETYLWDKCRADGGCKEIDNLWQFGAVIS